jgi:hypothetical protein
MNTKRFIWRQSHGMCSELCFKGIEAAEFIPEGFDLIDEENEVWHERALDDDLRRHWFEATALITALNRRIRPNLDDAVDPWDT